MLDEFTGHVLKPLCKMGSCRTFVRLDVSRDDVDTSPLGGVGGLKHRIGFACTSSVAKENLEVSPAGSSVIGDLVFLNCLEDEVWIDASVRCVALHSVAFLKRCPCVHTR